MIRRICLSIVATFLLEATASGQAVNATLLGTVTDATEAVVSAAHVVIVEVNTGVSRSTQTNESGNYSFPNLPPGVYSVSVEMTGFRKETRQRVAVVLNSTTRADMRLQPGSVFETVEVKAEAPALNTDRADTGRTIGSEVVSNVVLGANRNFQSLLNLVPGTTEGFVQFSAFRNASSTLQTQVNGQLNQGNSYLLEGVDNNNNSRGNQMIIPPAEAIETVQISTSNHDAELGHATGAVTNVMLKSGTNAYHGAAYEFHRNSAMDARSFFNPSRDHVAYNYAGGNLGGAIKKNRLFFFGDYLRVMDHEANNNLATVPSLAFRSGDLSAAVTNIYDPATGNPDGTGRQVFTGRQIPANRINPISTKLLGLLPAPNLPFRENAPSNNYVAVLPYRKTIDSFDAKMDAVLTANDRLSARLSYARPAMFQAPMFGDIAGGPAQEGFQGRGTTRIYSGGLNYARVFSPTFIMELRTGVGYSNNEALPSGYGRNDATNIGIPGVNIDPFTTGMVGVNVASFSAPLFGYSASIPWMKADTSIDVLNGWTKIAGNHTVKFGVDVRRLRSLNIQNQTYSPRGRYSFGANQTSTPGQSTGFGNSFASFLLDVPSAVGRDLNTFSPSLRLWQFSSWAGDQWQISRKLTINISLRWDLYPPATPPAPGGLSNYDPVNNVLRVAGIGEVPMNLGIETHYKYFAPRTGLAYRVNGETVVRAGFGISYVPPQVGTGMQSFNYPVRANNSYQPLNNIPYAAAILPNGQVAAFQLGFPPPAPVPIPSNGIIANPDRNSVYTVTPMDYKSPHVQTWNLAVQRSLPLNLILDVAYVGSHGVSVFAWPDINAGQVLGAGARGQPYYPRTAATTQLYRGMSSSYHALQAKLDRRFEGGLAMTTSITYHKAMDFQTGDDKGFVFYIDQQRDYARADFDRTFNFVQSYIYELPFGHEKRWLRAGPASAVLGGWQLSGILTLRTGTPLTFTANAAGLNAPGNTQTANLIAPIRILHGISLGNPWFDPSSFAQPAGAVFGNLGRNAISGPGMGRLDLSLFKKLRMTEGIGIEFRAESYNLTNTPVFANPSTSFTSATFGMVTDTLGSGSGVSSAGGGRWLRLGVKVTF